MQKEQTPFPRGKRRGICSQPGREGKSGGMPVKDAITALADFSKAP
jgi:hypothetical protein